MNDTTSRKPRRNKTKGISVRGKLLLLALVGVLATCLAGGVGIISIMFYNSTMTSLDKIVIAKTEMDSMNFSTADISGWQSAYALEAHTSNPAEAMKDDAPSRAGFIDRAARGTKTLD